jgi:hypothetical protein
LDWLLPAAQHPYAKTIAKDYRWDDYMPEMTDGEILQRLLKLNLAR